VECRAALIRPCLPTWVVLVVLLLLVVLLVDLVGILVHVWKRWIETEVSKSVSDYVVDFIDTRAFMIANLFRKLRLNSDLNWRKSGIGVSRYEFVGKIGQN
jgi:cell division protein FtsW (lipid II flippase)